MTNVIKVKQKELSQQTVRSDFVTSINVFFSSQHTIFRKVHKSLSLSINIQDLMETWAFNPRTWCINLWISSRVCIFTEHSYFHTDSAFLHFFMQTALKTFLIHIQAGYDVWISVQSMWFSVFCHKMIISQFKCTFNPICFDRNKKCSISCIINFESLTILCHFQNEHHYHMHTYFKSQTFLQLLIIYEFFIYT